MTLNEANEDLNGWTLQDEWNQIPVKEVSIKPSVDGNDKISLPYTFSSTDTTTYTITYTTPADVLLGTSQTLNKVVLENEEEKIEQETGVYVPDSEDAQPIQKEGVALKPIGPNLYEAEWMVRLNLDYSSLSPGWTYTDRLSGDGTSRTRQSRKSADGGDCERVWRDQQSSRERKWIHIRYHRLFLGERRMGKRSENVSNNRKNFASARNND